MGLASMRFRYRRKGGGGDRAPAGFHEQLLNAVGQAVIATDLSGRITYWNLAAERLYGWAAADVLGRDIVDVTPDARGRPEAEAVMERLRNGEVWSGEFEVRRRDGSTFLAHVTNTPLYDASGTLVGVVGTSEDVTEPARERVRAEEAARADRLLLDRALDVICTIDADGRFVWVSAASQRVWGYAPKELIGRRYQELVYDEDTARTAAEDRNVREGRATANFENRYRHRDGHLVDMLWSSYWSEEEALFFAIAMDVTERKRAEAVAHRARQRYERLLQHIDGIVWEGTANVRAGEVAFTFVSDRLRDVLGYEPRAWCEDSARWAEAIVEGDRAWAIEQCLADTRAGRDHTLEYRMTTACGRTVWVRDLVRKVEREGDVVTLAGLILDVTEAKRAEAELVEAKERAEEMTRLKSAFLANMSHEIRTPLTAIIGVADVLGDGHDPELAAIVRQGGERLLQTLDAVLDLAQLESGTRVLAPDRLDVEALVREVLASFAPQARAAGLTLHLEVEDACPLARADGAALGRVLCNLLHNAVKFTKEGGVTLRIGRDGRDVRIEVADTGVGISATFLPRLFDDFEQESEGFTRSHEGAGLGLSIAKRLLDLMGGTIEVESTQGVGSTFVVRVPAAEA